MQCVGFSCCRAVVVALLPPSMWDLSSLTTDQKCIPCIGRHTLKPLDHSGKYQDFIIFFLWLNNKAFYGYITFIYPFICWWIFGLFKPFCYYEKCYCKPSYKSFCVDITVCSLEHITKNGIIEPYGNSMFNFLRNCLWSHFIFCNFPKGLHNFSIPPAIHGLPPHSRQHLSLFVFFFKPLEWDKGVFYFDFDLHFIMTNDLSIIPCIYWPFLYPFCFWEKGHLRKMSIQILCPFVIGFSGFFFFFFFFWVRRVLYIF